MSASERGLLEGRRVLVVEDEYFLADDMERALRQLGAEVIGPVPTAEAAMAALERDQPIDAVVLDINLRGQMGFSVADALLARKIPFVFASGYDQAIIPSGYSHVGHWMKPFDARELVRTLPTLIRDKP
ncbi:MAG: response regulator [Acidisphaera sp.]|nr:response regulator [Acidisphaera sp.]